MAELAKSNTQIYSPEKTKKWLSWLARGMIAHNQTIFMIERLQPSWLPVIFLQWIYLLISRVTIILLAGCSVLIYTGAHFLLNLLVASVMIGIIISVGEIASEWLFSLINMDKRNRLNNLLGLLSYPMLFLIIYFIVNSLFYQLVSEYSYQGLPLAFWAIQITVFFGGRSVLLGLNQDIKAVEGISFSFKRMRIVAFIGLIIIIIGGLGVLQLKERSSDGWIGLGFLFFVSVVTALLSGLNKSVQDISNYPNQGLRLSIRNAMLIFGLIALFIFILIMIQSNVLPGGGNFTPISAFFYGFTFSWITGPILGFFGILFFGGIFVIKHLTLRCLLSLFGYLPWNLPRFLDYCVDLNFLQKVGGGYLFIHKYVMEHFAEIQL